MAWMSWDDLHEPRPPRETGPSGPRGGGGGGGPQFEIPQIKVPKFKPSSVLVAVLVLLGLWLVPSVFYFVEQDEEGVVVRFGKYVRTTQPGPHLKFPSPIEHVYTPKVQRVRRAEVGFRTNEAGQERDFPHESLMLTGDENIVDIDLVVQWRIKDAKDYLFNVRNQEKAVRDAAETTLRGIIGQNDIDTVLTTGRGEIQIQIQQGIQELLDSYQAGIEVMITQLKDVHPPSQVISAFKDVVSAKEDRQRLINEAQGYRNAVIPEARGKAAKVLREAEAYREEVIQKAEGDVSRFLKQFEEYRKAPEITRRRIYLETMEQIYPNMDKYLIPKKGGVLPVLPLKKSLDAALGRGAGR